MNQILHGNCFDIIPELAAKGIKVDAIIIDPPYNMTNNKWETPIDWTKWWQIIKPLRKSVHTPIIIFGDFPFSVDLIVSNRKWWRYSWYWNKLIGTGFLQSAWQPLKVIEHIHVFIERPFKTIPSKSSWKKLDRIAKFNPQFSKDNKNHSNGNRLTNSLGSTYHHYQTMQKIKATHSHDTTFYRDDLARIDKKSDDKHPKNYLEIQKIKPNKYRKEHPTAKPIALLEYLVKTYTNENDLILDCFAGNGTTAIACLNTNRNFIMIEQEQKYYDTMESRILECQTNLSHYSN